MDEDEIKDQELTTQEEILNRDPEGF